jgi:hypothetical protein
MASRWRTQIAEIRKRLPAGPSPDDVIGIIETILGEGSGGLDRISGLHYTACEGYSHPLDGQSIDFGAHGIARDQVPSPWRELLIEANPDQAFTFELDRAEQD